MPHLSVCVLLWLCLYGVPMCAWMLPLWLPVSVPLCPDQRSAAHLSHLVRHRICSVLQHWCEVQAPLTTLDPPVWAVWGGSGMTGLGWGMAADTGVTEPKGHEESHRDGENTGRVMEDNQRRGQLLWVAFASLSCSLALSFCISLLHTWLCHPLPPPLFCVSHFLSFPLSLLFALLLCWLQAMLSVPLSHSVMEGWLVEWRGDEPMEAFRTEETRTSFLLLPLNIILINFLFSLSHMLKTFSLYLWDSFVLFIQVWRYQISASMEVDGISFVFMALTSLTWSNVNSFSRAPLSRRNYYYCWCKLIPNRDLGRVEVQSQDYDTRDKDLHPDLVPVRVCSLVKC